MLALIYIILQIFTSYFLSNNIYFDIYFFSETRSATHFYPIFGATKWILYRLCFLSCFFDVTIHLLLGSDSSSIFTWTVSKSCRDWNHQGNKQFNIRQDYYVFMVCRIMLQTPSLTTLLCHRIRKRRIDSYRISQT